MRVRQYIENAIDRNPQRLTYRQIETDTGICRTMLSRYFAGSKDLTFADLLTLTQYIPYADEDEALDLLTDDYIEHARPSNRRALLLYLLSQGCLDRLDDLIGALTTTGEYHAWGSLIGAFAKFRRGELAEFELSEYASTIRSYGADLTAFKYVLVATDMHASNSHNVFAHFAAKAERALPDVESDDLRLRIGDLLNLVTEK